MPRRDKLTRLHGCRSTGARIARLLLALRAANSPGLTASQLTRGVGLSRATLYRDLVTIRRAGWPVVVTHDRRDHRRARWRIRRTR